MEIIITEIAQRIRDLREIMGYSVEEMAQAVDCTPEEYLSLIHIEMCIRDRYKI